LPDARRARYRADYGLSVQDANVMTEDKGLGDYFERVIAASRVKDARAKKARAKTISNWLSEVVRLLKANALAAEHCPLAPAALANLIDLLDQERITGKQAKDVLDEAFASAEMPEEIVRRKGIKPPINDLSTLERIVDEVLANNTKVVDDYRRGKGNVIQFLVGQVMKQTRGQARADKVQALLREKLGEAAP